MWSGDLKASLRIVAEKSIHKTSSTHICYCIFFAIFSPTVNCYRNLLHNAFLHTYKLHIMIENDLHNCSIAEILCDWTNFVQNVRLSCLLTLNCCGTTNYLYEPDVVQILHSRPEKVKKSKPKDSWNRIHARSFPVLFTRAFQSPSSKLEKRLLNI